MAPSILAVTMGSKANMALRAAILAVLSAFPAGFAPAAPQPDPDLERVARARYESGVQFLNGGRDEQALRDFQAVLESMGASSLADDAALRIARYRFEVEGDAPAAEAMLDRLLTQYPTGDVVPGAYLLRARIAREAAPPRLADAEADWERAVLASSGGSSPWAYRALTEIARLDMAFMRDDQAAGALLEALHGSAAAPAAPNERFEVRFLLARALARSGDAAAALNTLAALRRDVLADAGADATGMPDMADRALDLASLVRDAASSGSWTFLGGFRVPRDLDRPLRLRVSGAELLILDRDTRELQGMALDGAAAGVVPVRNAWSFAVLPDGKPVVAAERALVLDGRPVRLLVPDERGRMEPLDRIRSVAVAPEGLWVWDGRRQQVFRFAFSALFQDVAPTPRLSGVRLIERHPAGHLLVLDDAGGVSGYDAAGNSVLRLPVAEPRDVAFDDLGRLYVLDAAGPSIMMYDREFRQVATIASTDFGSAGIREPVSLDVGPDGSLHILDAARGIVGVFR